MNSFLICRSFMKKTSARFTGAALAVAGTSSLYTNAGNSSNKLALLGGCPVRTKSFIQSRSIFNGNEDKVLPGSDEKLVRRCAAFTNNGKRYPNDCHKGRMPEEHLSSQAFHKSFYKVRLKKYRESLQLPIIDNIRPDGKEKLSIEGKIAFLGLTNDIDDIWKLL